MQRLVRELIQLGAGGVLLEDQVWPKRCGHMRGKEVISAEEHEQKIRAAVEAREREAARAEREAARELLVVGRTDARAPLGLDEAIRRGQLYREAGADVIFIEAPGSVDELRRIGAEVPGPLMANMVEGGRTPILELGELHELGFEWVVYPLSGLLSAARALERAFEALATRGVSRPDPGSQLSFEQFTEIVGHEERLAAAERHET